MFYSGRGFSASSFSQFIVGDIIQMDRPDDKGLYGEIDHSMMLTKIVNGNGYITQHSVNYLNKSFIEVYYNNPQAHWYGMLLYSQY